MDITKIQKINAMAKELKKHGIVSSMEDGAKQAEKYVRTTELDDTKEFKKLQEQEHAAAQKSAPLSENVEIRNMESTLNQHYEMIKTLQTKINEMVEEINKLGEQFHHFQQQPQRVVEQPREEPKQQTLKESKPQEEERNNPRTGSYNTEDVAIDKFFYAGSKR